MPDPDRSIPAPSRRGTGACFSAFILGFSLVGITPALAAPETGSASTLPDGAGIAVPAPRPQTRPAAGTPGVPGITPGLRMEGITSPSIGGFEATLRARLLREGRRQGIDRPLAATTPFGTDDTLDDAAAAESGRRASRTILRSLRGALDEHVEDAARGSDRFSGIFRFLEARGGAPADPVRTEAASATGSFAPPAAAAPQGADVSFRFRLDAHPRLILGGRLGSLEGRVELPVLDREIRMAVEHPIGGHGGAALHAGHGADRGSWADLSLSLRF